MLGGIGENQSAVIRALLLIGADVVGLDLAQVEADLRKLLSIDLPDAIYARLRDLSEQVRTGNGGRFIPDPNAVSGIRAIPADLRVATSGERPHIEQPPEQQEAFDPLASVGFDFG